VLTPAFQGLISAVVQGENPIKAFFQGLAAAASQLLQKLIQVALQALIISAIFPGGIGVAGGVQGFGNIFKNLLGLASGGLVTGPTLALVGEGAGTSRSNPEVVAPLDQLRSMLQGMGGGGATRVIIESRTRGRDIVYSNARERRSQRRTTGR
jgi:hypothetical protein